MRIKNEVTGSIINDNTGEEMTSTNQAADVYIKGSAISGGDVAISQAQGVKATGTDAYDTIYTASGQKTHLYIYLGGSKDAILSLNGGTTDHFTIPAGSVNTFEILIADTTVIQAKNKTIGQDFANLTISAW